MHREGVVGWSVGALSQALSQERDARRRVEGKAQELRLQVERAEGRAEQYKGQLEADRKAAAASAADTQTAHSLKEAMAIIGELRAALQKSLARTQEAEGKTTQKTSYLAQQLVNGLQVCVRTVAFVPCLQPCPATSHLPPACTLPACGLSGDTNQSPVSRVVRAAEAMADVMARSAWRSKTRRRQRTTHDPLRCATP